MVEAAAWRIALVCLLLAAFTGCGKKGPLYLPDAAGAVVTRPAETPPASESTEAPNSPQTVDSQPAAPAAAPEVAAPEVPEQQSEDSSKKEKGATPPPPPEK